MRPLPGVDRANEMLLYLENSDGGATLDTILPAGYEGKQVMPACCPGLDPSNPRARCQASATRKLRAAGADLRLWDTPRGSPLDPDSIRRVRVRPGKTYRVWLDMTYRMDNPKTWDLTRAAIEHFGDQLRVLDLNASLRYITSDANHDIFAVLDADVRAAAKKARLDVKAHTYPLAYRSTSNMMRAAYTFSPLPQSQPKRSQPKRSQPKRSLWQRLCGLSCFKCVPTATATVTKCFLAPGYFCSVKALDGVVPGSAARKAMVVHHGNRSWPVVFIRGKGLSGGWARLTRDLGLERGDRIAFTHEREGSLRLKLSV